MSRDRIAALEEANAHLAREVETLSQQTAEQWERIEALTQAVLRLRDRVTTVEEAGENPHAPTRPPHW